MNLIFNKILFRSIFRNKYNWINIFGLTVSISVFMTIFLYIQNEYSYIIMVSQRDLKHVTNHEIKIKKINGIVRLIET